MVVRHLLAECLLATALLIPSGAAQGTIPGDFNDSTYNVVFLYPTKNQTFTSRDIVNVTYTSQIAAPHLFTFCYDPPRQSKSLPLSNRFKFQPTSHVLFPVYPHNHTLPSTNT